MTEKTEAETIADLVQAAVLRQAELVEALRSTRKRIRALRKLQADLDHEHTAEGPRA